VSSVVAIVLLWLLSRLPSPMCGNVRWFYVAEDEYDERGYAGTSYFDAPFRCTKPLGHSGDHSGRKDIRG
jgi:hypothetical protein